MGGIDGGWWWWCWWVVLVDSVRWLVLVVVLVDIVEWVVSVDNVGGFCCCLILVTIIRVASNCVNGGQLSLMVQQRGGLGVGGMGEGVGDEVNAQYFLLPSKARRMRTG